MKILIFIQYMFSVYQRHTRTDPLLCVPPVADMISRNSSNKINQYFHMNDNAKAVAMGEPDFNPLYKVLPLLDTVSKRSQIITPDRTSHLMKP